MAEQHPQDKAAFAEWVISQSKTLVPEASPNEQRLLEASDRLSLASARTAAGLADALAPFEITPARYAIARALFLSADQRLPLVEISKMLGVTTPNITQHIDWLEKRGWLVRAPHPTDRRVVLAQLTPDGNLKIRRAFKAVLRYMRDIWGGLDDADIQELTLLMKKFMQR